VDASAAPDVLPVAGVKICGLVGGMNGSSAPWMVKLTCLAVPSTERTVKVSTWVWPAFRNCTALLATA